MGSVPPRQDNASSTHAMGPTVSGGATQALAIVHAAAGDLALAYSWTIVCFKAWDNALER